MREPGVRREPSSVREPRTPREPSSARDKRADIAAHIEQLGTMDIHRTMAAVFGQGGRLPMPEIWLDGDRPQGEDRVQPAPADRWSKWK